MTTDRRRADRLLLATLHLLPNTFYHPIVTRSPPLSVNSGKMARTEQVKKRNHEGSLEKLVGSFDGWLTAN